jgi:hypothetical protein
LGSQEISHPYIHALVVDGVFSESGAFCALPATPSQLLVQQLRHAVLNYLVEEGQQVHVNVDEQLTPTFANDRYEYAAAIHCTLQNLLRSLIQ